MKEKPPQLLVDLRRLFADAGLVAETGATARALDKGHGRLERRRLQTSTALVGYSTWPGLAKVLCLEREVVRLNTGEPRWERVFAVTSLPPEQATARDLVTWWRGHWGIENRLPWVRDVGFSEDRSATRVGGVPHGLATLRNTVIGLLRAHGHTAIAASRRALAHRADAAVALLGL